MGRISKILTRVRDSLSDPSGDRWSDDRLLRLLDDAHRDIAIKAKLVRKQQVLPLVDGQAIYALDEEVYVVQRVTYETKVLPLRTRDWMDKHVDSVWELDTGLPECIVYDKTNLGQIQVYPIPDFDDYSYAFVQGAAFEYQLTAMPSSSGVLVGDGDGTVGDDYGVTVSSSYDGVPEELSSAYGVVSEVYGSLYQFPEVLYGGLYGIVTELADMPILGEYGVLADVELLSTTESNVFLNGSDPQGINGTYGVTTAFVDQVAELRYHYLYNTAELTSIDDSLVIDSVFDIALKYYVVGMALRDDLDAQNRSLAQEYLELYARELQEAIRVSERDFTQTTQYLNDYRSFI